MTDAQRTTMAKTSVAAARRAASAVGACALAGLLLLGGCGQKGALKRPDAPASSASGLSR